MIIMNNEGTWTDTCCFCTGIIMDLDKPKCTTAPADSSFPWKLCNYCVPMARTVETTDNDIAALENEVEDEICAMEYLVKKIDDLVANKQVAAARKEMADELIDFNRKAVQFYVRYCKMKASFEDMKEKFEDRE